MVTAEGAPAAEEAQAVSSSAVVEEAQAVLGNLSLEERAQRRHRSSHDIDTAIHHHSISIPHPTPASRSRSSSSRSSSRSRSRRRRRRSSSQQQLRLSKVTANTQQQLRPRRCPQLVCPSLYRAHTQLYSH